MLKLDTSIMSLGNIHEYHISRNSASHMILDGVTLNNLEILNNTSDGTTKGTLFKLVNRATTSFGKNNYKSGFCIHCLKLTRSTKDTIQLTI